MEHLCDTVGREFPETGAIGFGPQAGFGIEFVEYDKLGSAAATELTYAPEVGWLQARIDYWLNCPDTKVHLLDAVIHSHPAAYGLPSSKNGPGEGDMGYVEAMFENNEAMQFLALPILTNTGELGRFNLHPWLFSRDQPHQPQVADFRICRESQFPARQYNPQWLEKLEQATRPMVDAMRLADLLDGTVTISPIINNSSWLMTMDVEKDGLLLTILLPRHFPAAAPLVKLRNSEGRTGLLPLVWATPNLYDSTGQPIAVERRLARLCINIAEWLHDIY